MATTVEKQALPISAEELVPHRPPMLFVRELLEREGDLALVLAEFPEMELLPELFVELVAQAMAVTSGYDARQTGNSAREGMLVGVDEFFCADSAATAVVGGRYLVRIEKKFQFGSVFIVAGTIYAVTTGGKPVSPLPEGNKIAWGKLKVWEDAA